MAGMRETVALSSVIRLLQNSDDDMKRRFIERYKQLLFPESGSSVGQTVWKTWRNITRVTLWGREHFCNNVRLAMVKEALGLGPRWYCVMHTFDPIFSGRVFLLVHFLPHPKICVYPFFGITLGGNPYFLHYDLRETIPRRVIPVNERPTMCSVCASCFCDHALEDLTEL